MSFSVDQERQAPVGEYGSEDAESRKYGSWVTPPTRSAWRESALTRINELAALATWLTRDTSRAEVSPVSDDLAAALFAHLELARSAAKEHSGVIRSITGSQYERASSNIDAAEADLLQIAPAWYVRGQMPSLLRHVERHLCGSDRRLKEVQRIADQAGDDLTAVERGHIVGAHRAASSACVRQSARVRSFRNVLAVTSFVLVVLAVALAVAGFLHPERVPLCFEPEAEGLIVVVCPTEQSAYVPALEPPTGLASPDIDDIVRQTARPADVFTVEAVGLLAAAIAAAAGLRNIRGTSTPFSLPVALAILKLPTGALTAFLGLLLMRGGFVPGLSALDTSAQILAWALVFGYAQQVFTRFVDRQANSVLDSVGSAEAEPAAPKAE
jgi:hypothetical protein